MGAGPADRAGLLGLPGEAGEHLAARAALLDGTYREVASRLPDNAQIVFDDDGRLHFAAPEPASLLDLRAAVNAMLPRVDLPEVLLEVFSWTGADQAFTSVTGGEARLKDLHVTIAALLVAPPRRPKYFGFGRAYTEGTGTTNRIPSTDATSPPPHALARPMDAWCSMRVAFAARYST